MGIEQSTGLLKEINLFSKKAVGCTRSRLYFVLQVSDIHGGWKRFRWWLWHVSKAQSLQTHLSSFLFCPLHRHVRVEPQSNTFLYNLSEDSKSKDTDWNSVLTMSKAHSLKLLVECYQNKGQPETSPPSPKRVVSSPLYSVDGRGKKSENLNLDFVVNRAYNYNSLLFSFSAALSLWIPASSLALLRETGYCSFDCPHCERTRYSTTDKHERFSSSSNTDLDNLAVHNSPTPLISALQVLIMCH